MRSTQRGRRSRRRQRPGPEVFALGRDLVERFNAVEGLRLTEEMKRDFREFDRRGLSPDARRREIAAKYGKST